MKKFIFILLLLPLFAYPQAEKRHRSVIIDSLKALNGGIFDIKDSASFEKPVGIGGALDASALLTLTDTAQGFLVPRMTATQRNNIVSPATGLLVFDTDSNAFLFFDSSIWMKLVDDDGGVGDMLKSAYDNNNDSIVNNADSLNSQPPSFYLARASHTGTQLTTTIIGFQDSVSDNLDVTANTSKRHDAVTFSGTPDYITLSGQDIVRDSVDLTTDIKGNLPVANLNSGTGASGSTVWKGDGTWGAVPGDGDGIYDGSGTIASSTTSTLTNAWTIKGTQTITETFLDFTRSDDVKSVSFGITDGLGVIQVRNTTEAVDTRIGAGSESNSFFKKGLYIGEAAPSGSMFLVTTTNAIAAVRIKNSNNFNGITTSVNTTRTLFRLWDGQANVAANNNFVSFRSDNSGNWIQPGNDALAIGHQTGTAMLHIKGVNATSSKFALKVQDNVGTDLFNVRNDGNVGINNSTPTAKLHVIGDVIVDSLFSTPTKLRTLGIGVTTFVVAGNKMKITGDDGANTIATITGGINGMTLTITFVDALITLTDDNTSTSNTINLSAAFTSTANDILVLESDGISWREKSRSIN